MKNLCLITFGSLLSLSAISQTVIQAVDVTPVIGESFTVKRADWVSEGSSGSNVVWDHSGMQETGDVSTANFASPSGIFPMANITGETSNGVQSSFFHYEYTSSGCFLHGIESGSTVITYQNASKNLSFPISNTLNETDSFSATYWAGGDVYARIGTIEIIADGDGTLITPEGTFTDVIRVRKTIEYSDTDTIAGGTINVYTRTYSWYKAGVHSALASVSESSTDLGAPTQYSASYLTNVVLDIEEESALQVSMYPNPVSSVLSIDLGNGTQNVDHVDIIDLSGKKVHSEAVVSGSVQIDMQFLNEGIYFVKLIGGNGEELVTEKVIKE